MIPLEKLDDITAHVCLINMEGRIKLFYDTIGKTGYKNRTT